MITPPQYHSKRQAAASTTQRGQKPKYIALAVKPSASFISPINRGLYWPSQLSIPAIQSYIADIDSHSWGSSLASAAQTNSATETIPTRFCSPRVRPYRTMIISPSHLSSRIDLPPNTGEGPSSASFSLETIMVTDLTRWV